MRDEIKNQKTPCVYNKIIAVEWVQKKESLFETEKSKQNIEDNKVLLGVLFSLFLSLDWNNKKSSCSTVNCVSTRTEIAQISNGVPKFLHTTL